MRAGGVLRALRAAVFAAVCVLLASAGHVLMSGHSVPGWMLLTALLAAASAAWLLADRERGPAVVGALTVGTQALLHGVFSLGQALASHGGGSGGSLTGRWTAALLGHPLAPSPSPSLSSSSSPSSSGSVPPAGSSHAMHATHGMDGAHAMHGGGMGHHAHHAHHVQDAHQLGAAMPDPAAGAHGAMPGGTTGMIAAHVLVALIAAWWLWGGERAVFRAVRAASVRLFAPLALAVGAVLPAPAPRVRTARREPARAPRQLFLGHVIWLRGPPRGRAV